jgi:arginine/ornithine N-succinyltransferase beta subunit
MLPISFLSYIALGYHKIVFIRKFLKFILSPAHRHRIKTKIVAEVLRKGKEGNGACPFWEMAVDRRFMT